MTFRSIGLNSDLLVMEGFATVETHPDRFVVRTPAEPDFWSGNGVIFRHDRGDPETLISQFRADHPQSRHVTLKWDVPGMSRSPIHAELARMGFEIDEVDVLWLRGPAQSANAPGGIDIRPIESDADWAKVRALQVETGLEEGHDPADYRSFIDARMACHRRGAISGRCRWFGAFDGAVLAGDLGIYASDTRARFQSVETAADYRQRGICAALVSAGIDWAAAAAPRARAVIVADRGGPAGRVYRRRGFVLAETLISAIRRPEAQS